MGTTCELSKATQSLDLFSVYGYRAGVGNKTNSEFRTGFHHLFKVPWVSPIPRYHCICPAKIHV